MKYRWKHEWLSCVLVADGLVIAVADMLVGLHRKCLWLILLEIVHGSLWKLFKLQFLGVSRLSYFTVVTGDIKALGEWNSQAKRCLSSLSFMYNHVPPSNLLPTCWLQHVGRDSKGDEGVCFRFSPWRMFHALCVLALTKLLHLLPHLPATPACCFCWVCFTHFLAFCLLNFSALKFLMSA